MPSYRDYRKSLFRNYTLKKAEYFNNAACVFAGIVILAGFSYFLYLMTHVSMFFKQIGVVLLGVGLIALCALASYLLTRHASKLQDAHDFVRVVEVKPAKNAPNRNQKNKGRNKRKR